MCPAQNVATISAGNEELIGNLIAEALAAVGADGVLSIETGNSLETTVEVQEGMLIDRGYISPQFVTNNVCGLSWSILVLQELCIAYACMHENVPMQILDLYACLFVA